MLVFGEVRIFFVFNRWNITECNVKIDNILYMRKIVDILIVEGAAL